MNGATRKALHDAINKRRRELVEDEKRQGRCFGCGCHWDDYSEGCRTCHHRRYHRGKTPEQRAHDNELLRASRAKLRAKRKAARGF